MHLKIAVLYLNHNIKTRWERNNMSATNFETPIVTRYQRYTNYNDVISTIEDYSTQHYKLFDIINTGGIIKMKFVDTHNVELKSISKKTLSDDSIKNAVLSQPKKALFKHIVRFGDGGDKLPKNAFERFGIVNCVNFYDLNVSHQLRILKLIDDNKEIDSSAYTSANAFYNDATVVIYVYNSQKTSKVSDDLPGVVFIPYTAGDVKIADIPAETINTHTYNKLKK